MSLRTAVRPEPSTPSPKKKSLPNGPSRVDVIIKDLNAEYNLGIDLGDRNLTPSHRRERAKVDVHFAQCDRISRNLYFLYYQGGEGVLDKALHAFRRESKAACRNWISKPRADRDTLPSSSAPHKARTPGEQNELQEILVDVLDQMKELLQTDAIIDSGQAEPNDSFDIPSRPSQPKPKRPSNDGLENSSKRVKSQQAQPRPGQVTVAIDKVPARKKTHADISKEPRPSIFQHSSRSLNQSFYDASANTSKASLVPSIFSEVEFLPASQTTVNAGTQDRKKVSAREHVAHFPSTADSFAPSSGDIQALAESFSRFEDPDAEEALFDDAANTGVGNELRHAASRVGLERAKSPAPSTEYSEFSGLIDVRTPDVAPQPVSPVQSTSLEARLKNIWPKFPRWHDKAPLAVVWEFTRVCLHCGVDIDDVNLPYDPSWSNPQSYRSLWSSLRKHPAFSNAFPEPPDGNAWAAAMKGFRLQNMAVTLSASIDFNTSKDGPLFVVRLNPLRLEKGCRLNRRFGPDRFFEVLIPSINSKEAPALLQDEAGAKKFIHWLTRERHLIFCRQWAAFFTSDGGYRKPLKELRTSPDAQPVFKERIHFFAESGNGFKNSECVGTLNVGSVEDMLDWLLQFKRNEDQPFMKLFSRIQLGLSKTDPVITLDKHQIKHRKGDITSPAGKVMNDGIGRISVSLAREVQKALGLSDLPSAIQGRMGSAKGMWLVDVADMGRATADQHHWIETYHSQRKWNCDQTDPYQRTLEVHGVSHELRSSGLNLQFLPVLEDRARDRKKMRETIGQRMADDLYDELADLKSSMRSPLEFRQWVHSRGSSARAERVQHGQVPFLGGLPKRTEETMNFLLEGGFDPRKQFYLQELAWNMQLQKCEILKKKLNIRLGQSAYIYMVVDFWNILEENEVHVAFSSRFKDPQGKFSDVLLHEQDVLVARSPAHLVSDVQKVRAVFKTELRALKDVIVFSAKGNVPLADKLSGGDYDGDKAWVCWDPDIIDNFINADVPETPDLSAFVGKDKTTFGDLLRENRRIKTAVQDMIERSFQFNMAQSLLGQCTNYKEKLCYQKGTVHDEVSVVLSTLLSNLVDQSKQGILFGTEEWDRLRRSWRIPLQLPNPAYKADNWSGPGEPTHIVDYLKFTIIKKTIDQQLEAVHKELNPDGTPAPKWDEELAMPYHDFQRLAETSASCRNLLAGLHNSLSSVSARWSGVMVKDKDGPESSYSQRVTEVYDLWRAIEPTFAGRQSRSQENSKVVSLLVEPYLSEDRLSGNKLSYELSTWSILKASATFKLYYNKKNHFVWQVAGRQLQAIKAKVSSSKLGRVPILVEPLMYAGLTVDKKFVTQYVAMMEGQNSEYLGLEYEDYDEEEDDDA